MLGQLAPISTDPELLWSSDGVETVFGLVCIISNNTASPVAGWLYIDPDGDTADATTRIEKAVPANDYVTITVPGQIDFKEGTVKAETATANALTFHLMRLVV